MPATISLRRPPLALGLAVRLRPRTRLQLMAAGGIILRAVRWATAAASAAVAARRRDENKWGGWRGKQKDKEAVARVGEGEWGGAGERLRRAREAAMLLAEGRRLPLDVIPILDEAELEVSFCCCCLRRIYTRVECVY